MRIFNCVIVSVIMLMVVSDASAQQQRGIVNRSTTIHFIDEKPFFLHAVLQGQTLYSIALAYGVEEAVIEAANPDLRYGLRYDQVIRIPVPDWDDELEDDERELPEPPIRRPEVAPEPEGDFVEHKVLRQETLYGLSRVYGISMEKMLFYNPDARAGLMEGQVLRIPSPEMMMDEVPVQSEITEDESGAWQIYTASSGETVYGISRQFEISEEELVAFNPSLKEGLRAGQQLRIPLREVVAERPKPSADPVIIIPGEDRIVRGPQIDPYCLSPRRQTAYDVALLIPFFLEDVFIDPDSLSAAEGEPDAAFPQLLPEVALSSAHPAFAFITYYHGVLLAVDSIRQSGAQVNLHVFDVCQDLEKARRVIDNEGLEQMDLIIGPFHGRTLEVVAAFGQTHDIPVVSPLLPDRSMLSGMPRLFNVEPSMDAMLQEVADHVAYHYPRQNIILVHNQQPGAAEIVKRFENTLLRKVAQTNFFYDSLHLARVNGYFLEDALVGSRRTNVMVMPDLASGIFPVPPDGISVSRPDNFREVIFRREGMEGVFGKMVTDRKNVLITLAGGEPFVADYLRQLHEHRNEYDITVFGIADWQSYSALTIDHLQNLSVHIFTPDFYDYRDMHIQDFVRRYRSTFHLEPDHYAFKGVQTAYFFLNGIQEYGVSFDRCIPILNSKGYESPFSFERTMGADGGFENTNTSIYRIQNFRQVDVQRPIPLVSEGQVEKGASAGQ